MDSEPADEEFPKTALEPLIDTVTVDEKSPEGPNLDDEIATASAESESYAAADAAKSALHVKHYGSEMGIKMPDVVAIGIDAAAALGSLTTLPPIPR